MNKRDLEHSLGRLGYEVIYRHDGWTECLVHGHEEGWRGDGVTAEDALRVATRKRFPSAAAMTVLGHIADDAPVTVEAVIPTVPETLPLDEGSTPLAEMPSHDNTETEVPREIAVASEPVTVVKNPPDP